MVAFTNRWKLRLPILGFLLFAVSIHAATLRVPDDYPTINLALSAAVDDDVIRITDSGEYVEDVYINKRIQLIADIGQSPVIKGTGTQSYVILTGNGANGAQIGDVGAGQIVIDGNGSSTVERLIYNQHDSGAVAHENLLLRNPSASTQAIYPTAAGDSYYREIEIDGNDVAGILVRLDYLGGGSLTFDMVSIYNAPDIGFYCNTPSGSGTVRLVCCSIETEKRPVYIDSNSGPLNFDIDCCYIRNTDNSAAWDLVSIRGSGQTLDIRDSVLQNRGTGSTFYFFPGNNSSAYVDHCDITGPNIGIRFFTGTGRNFEIHNVNLTPPNGYFGSLDAGDSFTATNVNNVSGVYDGFPAGSGAQSRAPGYHNESVGDFFYTDAVLKKAGTNGSQIGSYLNFSTPIFQPGDDTAYIAEFQAHYSQSVPAYTLDEYYNTFPYDRFNGPTLDARLALIAGGWSPTVGGDTWSMSLNEMYRMTGAIKYFRENLKLVRVVMENRDDHRTPQEVLWDGTVGAPVWSTDYYSSRGRETYVLHEGQILYPIFDFLLFVQDDPTLLDEFLPGEYSQLLADATQSLEYHDFEWVDGPGVDEGYYKHPADYEDSAYANVPTPFNWQSAAGRALWKAYELTGNTDYCDRAFKLARYIKRRLGLTPDGAYIWEYYLPTLPEHVTCISQDRYESSSSTEFNASFRFEAEDTSHAVLSAMFPIMMAEAGEVFDEVDMQRFGRTVKNGIGRLGNGIMTSDVAGNPDHYLPAYASPTAGFLRLASYYPEVYPIISAMYLNYDSSPGPLDNALLLKHDPRRTGGEGELLVPDYYNTLVSAYSSAMDNNTIRITDSGVYSAGFFVRRQIRLVADSGETPTIQASEGDTYLLIFDDGAFSSHPWDGGAQGAQIGSSSGGTIIFDAADSSSLTHIFRLQHTAGNITFENIEIGNIAANTSSSLYVFFPGTGASGDTTFRSVDVDCGNRANFPFRLNTLTGTLNLIESKVYNVARSPIFSDGGTGGTVNIEACYLQGAENGIRLDGGTHSINIDRSWIRTITGGSSNFGPIYTRSGSDFTVTHSVLQSLGTNTVAFCLFHDLTAFDAEVNINHCDLISDSGFTAFRLVSSSATNGADILVNNTNFVNASGRSFEGTLNATSGDTYSGDHNNRENLLGGAMGGPHDLSGSSYILPPYADETTGDFRYVDDILEVSSSEGNPVGSYLNYPNNPPLSVVNWKLY